MVHQALEQDKIQEQQEALQQGLVLLVNISQEALPLQAELIAPILHQEAVAAVVLREAHIVHRAILDLQEALGHLVHRVEVLVQDQVEDK